MQIRSGLIAATLAISLTSFQSLAQGSQSRGDLKFNGHDKAIFGMNIEQLRQVYPGIQVTDPPPSLSKLFREVRRETFIAGWGLVKISYYFDRFEALNRIIISVSDSTQTPQKCKDRISELQASIVRSWGGPTSHGQFKPVENTRDFIFFGTEWLSINRAIRFRSLGSHIDASSFHCTSALEFNDLTRPDGDGLR